MNGTELSAVTDGVERLERSHRRWKFCAICCAALTGIIFSVGAAGTNLADEIRTKELLLVDKDGKVRAWLDATGLFFGGKGVN